MRHAVHSATRARLSYQSTTKQDNYRGGEDEK